MNRTSLLAVCAACSAASAQADFVEHFDANGADGGNGPANLVARGWEFRNQCDPVSGPAWYDGDGFGGEPFSGGGYLGTSSLATDFFGGGLSTWALLPTIPNQSQGDEVSLWVLGGGSATSDTFFEIRYAPSGSGTGSGPDEVGDFTEVLYSAEMPIATQGYQRVSAPIPGSGRIALRFRADHILTFAGNGAYLSVDELTVGESPDGPCGLAIPQPGETAVWTAADSPHVVCQDLLVPEGARVEVEGGAVVEITAGARLRAEGEFVTLGTSANPVVILGSTSVADGLDIGDTGRAELAFTELGVSMFVGGEHASAWVRDSTVTSGGLVNGVADLVVIERCTFDGGAAGGVTGLGGTVRIDDTSFVNGATANLIGLVRLDGVSVDGAPLVISSETWAYPMLIDNVSATNYLDGAGIQLTGPNYLLGPNVTTQNNFYPLSMTGSGAGLLPGSRLPREGNANNSIPVDQFLLGPERYWANAGVPYVVQGGFPENYGGTLIVEPGSVLEFGPGAGAFLIGSANTVFEGTRELPIHVRSRFAGSSRWFGLKWVDVFDAKARHTIFDGGEITVQSDGGVMDLVHCIVRNSLEGTASVTGGIVRLFGSQIVDNDVGMVTTTSGRIEADGGLAPSIFEGNAIAIDYNNTNGLPYLRFNWWGEPTGPTTPFHPDGTGDVVQDVHPAAFTPYLASPPAQGDDFPVVRMMPTYFYGETGDKIILRWDSSDDHGIVEQRIEWADVDFPDDYELIATLPGDATTYEFTLPTVEPTNRYPTPSAIRIVAVDTAGQEAWDKSKLRVPYFDDWTVVPQDVAVPAGDLHPHDRVDVCWTPGGLGSAYVLLDGQRLSRTAGGSNTGCLPIGAGLPYASTDTARILIITTFGAGGRLIYNFSEPFAIRPDERFGDAPPAVSITSPSAGAAFSGGGVIPIAWTADDDESLRSFGIQASYDGGKTWHFVARDLPGETRAFNWRLPASTGIADVRVRVTTLDHRFQESSDTLGPITILAGDASCPADVTGDGALDTNDFFEFLSLYQNQSPRADFTGDGAINTNDFFAFLAAYQAGCA